MVRTLMFGSLTLCMMGWVTMTTDAQEKKAQKAARIAINDPANLKDDLDFAIQGEYAGSVKVNDLEMDIGIHLIAQGNGRFLGKAYNGGLPGGGWDGGEPYTGAAKRENGKTVVMDNNENVIGEVKDNTIVFSGGALEGTIKRVTRESNTLGAKPPEGAVVLFGAAGDESKWSRGKLAELSDGKFLTVEKTGSIKSNQAFGAFKAHIEFRLPWMPNSRGQGRGNSGVYIQDRYELQVLDSFGLTGENNECGGFYQAFSPRVNMCYPPMQWQTYDIDFTPAQFEGEKRVKGARVTVRHNGIVIHDNVEFKGPTPGGQKEASTPGPFQFQDHGDPLVFRNVWVVETK